jgi:hypothetical protein
VSLNLKLMVEDLDNLVLDLKEIKAPRRQISKAEKAHEAVLSLMYCMKQDCPHCFPRKEVKR